MSKIIRMRDREKGYTNIRNSIFLERGLSLKATGLYCLMWSLPDDWQFSINGLAQICADGPDSIRSALIELGEHRFINRVRTRTEVGTLAGIDYQLWESPMLENPTQVNPRQETTQGESTNTVSLRGDKENGVKTRTCARFIPPTVEEVAAYCKERRNTLDAEEFVAHYTANGWMQGKGKPIRDWKACVVTWEKNAKNRVGSFAPKKVVPFDYD